jgi:hypothetical protein
MKADLMKCVLDFPRRLRYIDRIMDGEDGPLVANNSKAMRSCFSSRSSMSMRSIVHSTTQYTLYEKVERRRSWATYIHMGV